jgi:hypothetical protein
MFAPLIASSSSFGAETTIRQSYKSCGVYNKC